MSHVTVPVPTSPGGDLGEAALSPLHMRGSARPPDAPLIRFLIRSLSRPQTTRNVVYFLCFVRKGGAR
jgi:hypothetical protein